MIIGIIEGKSEFRPEGIPLNDILGTLQEECERAERPAPNSGVVFHVIEQAIYRGLIRRENNLYSAVDLNSIPIDQDLKDLLASIE